MTFSLTDVELETEQTMEDVIKDYVSQVRDRNEFQDMKLAPNQIILAKSNEHGGRWLRATAVSCSSRYEFYNVCGTINIEFSNNILENRWQYFKIVCSLFIEHLLDHEIQSISPVQFFILTSTQ